MVLTGIEGGIHRWRASGTLSNNKANAQEQDPRLVRRGAGGRERRETAGIARDRHNR